MGIALHKWSLFSDAAGFFVYFAAALPPSGPLERILLALRPSGLLERKFITGLKPVMEIGITVTAAPSQENLLLDVAATLQRDFNGALEFHWLGQGEAMDLILPSPGDAPETPQPADFGRAELYRPVYELTQFMIQG